MAALGIVSVVATVIPIVSIKKAETVTAMNWHLRGRKMGLTTEIKGRVEAEYVGLFWYDRIKWNGISRAWSPPSKKVSKISHSIRVWVEGSGTPSISTGFSAGTSGLDISAGVTTNPSGNAAQYNYLLKNQQKLYVDFSTSGYIWRWSYVGWKSQTEFLEEDYRFILVDGETNAVKDARVWAHNNREATIKKFADRYDNHREAVGSVEWPYSSGDWRESYYDNLYY